MTISSTFAPPNLPTSPGMPQSSLARLLQILAELWYMQDLFICLERFPRCFFIFHPKLWMTIRID